MFSFTTNPTITITFDNQDARAKKNFKLSDKETVEIPIYSGQENISGVVDVAVPAGKKIEHQGIRIEMIGQTGEALAQYFIQLMHGSHFLWLHNITELYYDKGNNIKFTSLVRELETAGTMNVTKV
jgi:vacuolar protein sorting-associated protein 26